MSARSILKTASILALALLCLPPSALAAAASTQTHSELFQPSPFSELSRLLPTAGFRAAPGEVPAVADFDGDQKPDIAAVRLKGNQYQIVVWLSASSDIAILNSPVSLAGFAVQAYDINGDSFQDVVVTSSLGPHPLAIWLGDGKGEFRAADRSLYKTDSVLAQSTKIQTGASRSERDISSAPSRPLFDKTDLAFGDIRLDCRPLRALNTVPRSNQNPAFFISPRSPPISALP